MPSDIEQSLSAVLEQAYESELLQSDDWAAIAAEAASGCASAQYIVAVAFEKQGDRGGAQEWFQRSAVQGYSPAVLKLVQLKPGSAA